MNPPATTETRQTPLAPLHRAAGAHLGAWFGCELPDDFGDWQAEYGFARQSVALIDKNYRAYLSFTGPDRVRYLNAILTNNIRDLQPGQAAVSLLLNPQGHILAEMETYAFPERLLGVSYAMIRERLVAELDKFIIMDDVTLADETGKYGTLALEGPRSAAVVRELCGIDLADLPELGHVEARFAAASLSFHLSRRSPGSVAGAEFFVERDTLAECWNLLREAVQSHGGGPMGYTALNSQRLELNVPWFGYDFDEKQIPHEAGLQDTHISYVKGCYTGQEIVERVRSRGHVNRVRVLLKFSAVEPPKYGTALLIESKEVGTVTRASFSLLFGSAIGMGYVRREYSGAGTLLSCPPVSAEVVTLPRSS